MKFQVMSRNLPEDHPAPPVSSSGMMIHAQDIDDNTCPDGEN
jgi:hypothetical protein